MIGILKSLFKRKVVSPYTLFKTEYHRRYRGTWMGFGYHSLNQRWELLIETDLPDQIATWALANGGVKVASAGHYEDCSCCKRSLDGSDE